MSSSMCNQMDFLHLPYDDNNRTTNSMNEPFALRAIFSTVPAVALAAIADHVHDIGIALMRILVKYLQSLTLCYYHYCGTMRICCQVFVLPMRMTKSIC